MLSAILISAAHASRHATHRHLIPILVAVEFELSIDPDEAALTELGVDKLPACIISREDEHATNVVYGGIAELRSELYRIHRSMIGNQLPAYGRHT